jgi:hypothetical protein
MPLDPIKPTDQELNSTWPWWIRAIHAYINNLELIVTPAGSIIAITNLNVTAGDTSLSVGIELSTQYVEVIFVSGGAANLRFIYGGRNGQVKIFVFLTNTVSVRDGNESDGEIYLNQLPVGIDFDAQDGDVLVLVNVGGNGAGIQGYWKELYRQVAVK